MLGQFLAAARLHSPLAAQQLGLAGELTAISLRHARVGSAWASHLAASREVILEGANRCSRHGWALIIGAGDGRDVPVKELAERFELTVLADIVVSAAARNLARSNPGRVVCQPWDATGAIAELARRRNTISASEAVSLFEQAKPEPLPGMEPDLVVSANCLSQLGLIHSNAVPAARANPGLAERCAQAAACSHLRWMAQRSGTRVLIGDIARLDVAPDGHLLRREDWLQHLPLRPPDRVWRWNLAPIPEWSPDFHRVHEVGAWIEMSPVDPIPAGGGERVRVDGRIS